MGAAVDLEAIEALNIKYSDDLIKNGQWKNFDLADPLEEIDMFCAHIPGKHMLDVGCGWARYVHRFDAYELVYTGIDHSAEMIKLAKSHNPEKSFEVMSYRSLSFDDESFDGLWCCCVFAGEPKSNIKQVLGELRRVLRPGGIILVIMPEVNVSGEELLQDDNGEPLLWSADYELVEFQDSMIDAGFEILHGRHSWRNGAFTVLARK